MEYNKIYNIELKTITPVHVGGASENHWVANMDYIYKQGNIYILDHSKIAAKCDNAEIAVFTENIINRDLSKFLNLLKNRKGIELKDISKHVFEDVTLKPENDIKAFIKTGNGSPYIPGSSIKGAIRSVLFNRWMNPNKRNDFINGQTNSINESIFGTINNNVMRFLQVSDVEFTETDLFTTKIFSLTGRQDDLAGGWKHGQQNSTSYEFKEKGFTTTYEVIREFEKKTMRMVFNQNSYNSNRNNNIPNLNKLFTDQPLNTLFKTINLHSIQHLTKEINFFEKFQNDETDLIIHELESIKKRIPSDNSKCILRLACGSGFHSITGDWIYPDHTDTGFYDRGPYYGRMKYKSRKLAFADFEDEDNTDEPQLRFFPMGFVELSLKK